MLKDIILTSEENYETLANGGSITKDGETFTYDDDSVYAVETKSLGLDSSLEIVDGKLKVTGGNVPTKTSDLTNDGSDGTNPFLSSITSSQITTALGFTPYNSTNPSGFQTSTNVDSKISTHNSNSSAHSTLFAGKQATITSSTALTAKTINAGIIYQTTAPTAANTNGVKIAILDTEPSTKYDGWLYFIKGE